MRTTVDRSDLTEHTTSSGQLTLLAVIQNFVVEGIRWMSNIFTLSEIDQLEAGILLGYQWRER